MQVGGGGGWVRSCLAKRWQFPDNVSTIIYTQDTIHIIESSTFKRWVRGLRDRAAVARINARLRNVTNGHFGDVRAVGDGVSEMRIQSGPGYRVYFIRDGAEVVVLLCGGDKNSQIKDIQLAKQIARERR